MRRLPQDLREFKKDTGANLFHIHEKLDRVLSAFQIIEQDNRAYRNTQEILTVRISEYLPWNSQKSLKRFFEVKKREKRCIKSGQRWD